MGHATKMSVPDGPANFFKGRHKSATVGFRVSPLVKHVLQRPAVDQPHDKKWASVGKHPYVVDRRNAWVLQPSSDPGGTDELAESRRVGGESFAKNLDRDITTDDEVGRTMYNRRVSLRDDL
jgi:hypothetical protein